MVNLGPEFLLLAPKVLYKDYKGRFPGKKTVLLDFVQIPSPPPPTVGQEAVKLICQSERKTQQNAKISLWPLFSTDGDLILM